MRTGEVEEAIASEGNDVNDSNNTNKDPRTIEPKGPFPKQDQPFPGDEAKMNPLPDFGEKTYQGSRKLEGKVALITGADSGIGRAVALAYAREGADIAISYLSEDEDAKETARVVEDAGRTALLLPGDIRENFHCQSIISRTVSELGSLDILVSNAAFQSSYDRVVNIPDEDWHRAIETNLDAMFYLTKAAIPHLPKGGAIIITTSIQAQQPSPSLLHYAVTKGAQVTYTKALAEDLIKDGVRVNAVAPGPIWTPLIVSTLPSDSYQTFGEDTPLERAGQPAELAPAYVFLASSDSTYITGETIAVTGGNVFT